MYPAWYAETFPQRERSNPAAYASLPPPLKGVRCSSLNARRSFARKAAPAFAGGPRRRLPGRRATSPRSTFSGSFRRVPGSRRPSTARCPARYRPNGSAAHTLRRVRTSTIPGSRGGERSPSTRTGKGTGGRRGRTGSPNLRIRGTANPGGGDGTSSWCPGSPSTGEGTGWGTGSAITTGSSGVCRRSSCGSGLPARVNWFRRCRSIRGTCPSTRWRRKRGGSGSAKRPDPLNNRCCTGEAHLEYGNGDHRGPCGPGRGARAVRGVIARGQEEHAGKGARRGACRGGEGGGDPSWRTEGGHEHPEGGRPPGQGPPAAGQDRLREGDEGQEERAGAAREAAPAERGPVRPQERAGRDAGRRVRKEGTGDRRTCPEARGGAGGTRRPAGGGAGRARAGGGHLDRTGQGGDRGADRRRREDGSRQEDPRDGRGGQGGAVSVGGYEGADHRPRGTQHPRIRSRHRDRRHHRRHPRGGHPVRLQPGPAGGRPDLPDPSPSGRANPPGADRGDGREGDQGGGGDDPRSGRAGALRPRDPRRPRGTREADREVEVPHLVRAEHLFPFPRGGVPVRDDRLGTGTQRQGRQTRGTPARHRKGGRPRGRGAARTDRGGPRPEVRRIRPDRPRDRGAPRG